MKKFLLAILLFCTVFTLTARTIYITRHGQRGDRRYFDAAVREPKLTPLGVEQATSCPRSTAPSKPDCPRPGCWARK